MRKFRLLAAVAGLALTGSVANADFVISSTRTPNGNGTDTVQFKITQNGTGTNTQPNLVSYDLAVYAPTSYNSQSFANNGIIIQTDDSTTANSGFANITGPAGTPASFLTMPSGWVQPGPASILVDQGGTVDSGPSNGNYTDGQKVAGIAGSFGAPSGTNAAAHGVSTTSGFVFATAVVPTGDPVGVLQPTPAGEIPGLRTIYPTWELAASEFTSGPATGTIVKTQFVPAAATGAAPNYLYVDAVPEPGTLSLVGLGLGGLLARRRRA